MQIIQLALSLLCALSSIALAAPATGARGPIKRARPGNRNGGPRGPPINLVMGNGNLNVLPSQSAQQIIGNLSMINPKPLAIVPLLYNTNLSNANAHANAEFITVMNWLDSQNIPYYLGIGLAPVSNGQINTTAFKELATQYAKWSDRIQISAGATVFYPSNPVAFTDTMRWLNESLGFKHIQLNGWPRVSPQGGLVDFSDIPAIDSVFYAVTNKTYTVNTDYLPHFYSLRDDINVMVNYENPSQQSALASLSQNQQLAAFQATINSIQQSPYYKNNTLQWTVPWTRTYVPQSQGTWTYCLKQLTVLSSTLTGVLNGLP